MNTLQMANEELSIIEELNLLYGDSESNDTEPISDTHCHQPEPIIIELTSVVID